MLFNFYGEREGPVSSHMRALCNEKLRAREREREREREKRERE